VSVNVSEDEVAKFGLPPKTKLDEVGAIAQAEGLGAAGATVVVVVVLVVVVVVEVVVVVSGGAE